MKVTVKTIRLGLTPSLKTYIENKLGPLAKFVRRFDETGEAEVWVEVARITRHHKKGDVFEAMADLRLPKKILRAEAVAFDVRAAINKVKDELRGEITKYRTKFLELNKKELSRRK